MLLQSILTTLALILPALADGCPTASDLNPGLRVDYYDNAKTRDQLDAPYGPATSNTKLKTYLTTLDGTNPNFIKYGVIQQDFKVPTAVTYPVYGVNVTSNSFALKLTGFFCAPQDGKYQFNADVDDMLTFHLDISQANCCINPASTSLAVGTIYTFLADNPTTTFTLTKGECYPVKLIYYDNPGTGYMNINMVYPDGTSHVNDLLGTIRTLKQKKYVMLVRLLHGPILMELLIRLPQHKSVKMEP